MKRPTRRDAARLRRQAEGQLAARPPRAPPDPASPAELLHDLQVHQVELEMQNEELQRARVELEEARDRYVALYDFAPVGYLTIGPEGQISSVNLTGAALLGTERAKLLSRPFMQLVVLEEQARWTAHLALAQGGAAPPTIELLMQPAGRAKFHAQISCIPAPSLPGVKASVRCSLQDITERRRAEDGLRTTQLLLEKAFEQSPVPTVLVSMPDRKLRIVNPATRRFLGIEDEPAPVGASLRELKPSWLDYDLDGKLGTTEDLPLARSLRGQRTHGEERRIVRKDGTTRHQLVSAAPIFDDAGRLIGACLTMTDITERKDAEEASREFEARYHRLLDYTYDWEAWQDPGGTFLYCSPSCERISGHPPEAFTSDPGLMERLVHPQDLAAWEAHRVTGHDARSTPGVAMGPPREFHFRILHPDGAVRWIGHICQHLYDPGGQALGLRISNRDITAARIAEEARLAVESKYRDLFENLRSGIVIHAPDTSIVLANSTACQLLGLTLDQLRGKVAIDPAWRFVHEDGSAMPLPEFPVNRVLATGAGVVDQVIGIDRPATGDRAWVLVNAYPGVGEAGRLDQVVVTFVDITERKQAAALFREATLRQRIILQTSMDGFWMTDPGGRLLEVNDTYCRMSGYTAAELVEMQVTDLETIESAEATAAHLGKVMALGEDRFESRHRRKDGSLFDVEVSVQYRAAEGGYLAVFLRDITERKQAEETLRKSEAQFQQSQKMESVGRLAGGVAHDFNNMLGVILGHVDMALEEVDPALPLHDDLKEIEAAATRSADLTRQLLAFARKQTIKPVALDLNPTVARMLKLLQRLLGEDIHLTWRPGPDLWLAKVDPSQLDQILANLCVNARDAIAGVGQLIIETRNATVDEAYCATHPDAAPGEYVQLVVSDNGSGMDKETQSHLFEPFFTTKAIGKGTGLGLATVYGIVKQSGGFFAVYSEPGSGSTFTVYLPKHLGQALPEAAAAAPAVRGQETIQVVEDEPGLLKVTSRMLERLGYTVLASGSPSDAIRLAGEHSGQIHLLLTDVVMPEMNGPELAGRLGILRPHLKHMFMSGYTANIIAHQGVLREGVNFIQKPFIAKDLAAAVRAALDG